MITKFIVAAALTCASVAAQAAILVDQSPDTIGFNQNSLAANIASSQNFLIKFNVGAATTLTGFDIYSSCNSFGCPPISAGAPVVVKFTADLAGAPDFANILSFATTLTAVDSFGSTANPAVLRLHADVTLPVAAGDYWFGISGDNIEIGLSLGDPLNSPIWLLTGNSGQFDGSSFIGAAYNVYAGASGGVPEPASWAMLIAGFGLTGAAMRRRRTAVAA
jgi:PEP-CTERM motif